MTFGCVVPVACIVPFGCAFSSCNTPRLHPYSPHIFYSFDELLLLKRGGEVVYNGPLGGERARLLVSYFEAVEGMEGCVH